MNAKVQQKPYKPTRVEPHLLEQSDSNERYDFLIENHEKAIKLLKLVKPEQHFQAAWVIKKEENVCGTAACALGWVALTGIIDGLQYTIDKNRSESDQYIPVVNSEASDWDNAGELFFGEETHSDIFGDGSMRLPEIIDNMKDRLDTLRKDRKQPRKVREYV